MQSSKTRHYYPLFASPRIKALYLLNAVPPDIGKSVAEGTGTQKRKRGTSPYVLRVCSLSYIDHGSNPASANDYPGKLPRLSVL